MDCSGLSLTVRDSPLQKNKIIMKNEVYAAIALALYEFKGNNVHDREPGIITISEKQTQWNGYAQTMTEHP